MPIPLGILASAGAGAAAANAYELIQSQVLSSQTSAIEFSSIPQTYSHLQIRVSAASNASGNYSDIYLAMNGIYTTNYNNHRLLGNGSSVLSSNNTSTQYPVAGKATSTDITNAWGGAVIDIYDYTSTSKRKVYKSLNGNVSGSAGSGPIIELSTGLITNTTAVTSVALYLLTYQFLVGSRFSLYGIKGA